MQNHIGLALRNLQGTLRDVTSTNARRRMDEAMMGLQGAKFQHEISRQNIADNRYDDQVDYSRERDALGDTRYEDQTQYSRGRDAEQFGFAKEQATAANQRADRQIGISAGHIGLAQQRQQREADEFNTYKKPLLDRGLQEFKQEEKPATIEDLYPAIEHRQKALEQAGAYDVMVKALGAEVDPNTKQLMKGGKPIPLWELKTDQNKKNLQRITMSSLFPDQDSEFLAAQIEDKIQAGEQVSDKEKAFYEKVTKATPEQKYGIIKKDLANMNATVLALESEGADPAIIDYVKRNMERQTAYLNALAKVDEKDTRGGFEKDATFLSQVTGMSPADAANAIRADKTLGDRLQLAKAQIESIQGMMLEPAAESAKINEAMGTLGLNNQETMGLPRQEQRAPLQAGSPEYQKLFNEVAPGFQSLSPERQKFVIDGAMDEYGEEFANDLRKSIQQKQTTLEITPKTQQSTPKPQASKPQAANQPSQNMPIMDEAKKQYKDFWLSDNGDVYGYDKSGKAVLVIPSINAKDKYRNMDMQNKSIDPVEYNTQALKELGLYDEYVSRFGR